MQISRDADGFRFIGEYAPETGFMAADIQCVRCGRRIDSHVKGRDVALACTGCETRPKVFWSEAEMRVYLAENWNLLRQACAHSTVTAIGIS
jgi:hypothetical protein